VSVGEFFGFFSTGVSDDGGDKLLFSALDKDKGVRFLVDFLDCDLEGGGGGCSSKPVLRNFDLNVFTVGFFSPTNSFFSMLME